MTKSRTYYGEYSLKRWIDLLITQNIILPEYQRHFVWNKQDLDRLIKSLKDGQFIQPVTIGLHKEAGGNLLLDGQQRLTSILLSYLGYFPKKEKFESPEEEIALEDDSALEEAKDNPSTEVKSIKWTIRELYGKGRTIQELQDSLSSDSYYEALKLELDKDFFETHFIGFSFIIPNPNAESKDETQEFFTHLFRNMNYLGQKLSPAESRKSLYYQNPTLTNYFEGKTISGEDVLCGLKVTQDFKPRQIDFIRYLSILSQKQADKKVMLGYSAYNKRESFYADYVAFLLKLEQESNKDKFNGFDFGKTFPTATAVTDRYNELRKSVECIKKYITLDNHKAFGSWIDADLWLFGLIYHIVFENKELSQKEEQLEKLKHAIDKEIESKNKNESYKKRSNALGNLRERIDKSIEIYTTHVS